MTVIVIEVSDGLVQDVFSDRDDVRCIVIDADVLDNDESMPMDLECAVYEVGLCKLSDIDADERKRVDALLAGAGDELVWACPNCKSSRIQTQKWVRVNTGEVLDDTECYAWCEACEEDGASDGEVSFKDLIELPASQTREGGSK